MFTHNKVKKASDFILFMYVIDASTVFIHCIHQQVSKQNFIKGKSKMFYLLDLNWRDLHKKTAEGTWNYPKKFEGY
jgi:hypothetical protein